MKFISLSIRNKLVALRSIMKARFSTLLEFYRDISDHSIVFIENDYMCEIYLFSDQRDCFKLW